MSRTKPSLVSDLWANDVAELKALRRRCAELERAARALKSAGLFGMNELAQHEAYEGSPEQRGWQEALALLQAALSPKRATSGAAKRGRRT